MREGGLPLLPALKIIDYYNMKSLRFRFGHMTNMVSLLASKWQGLKVGMPVFQLFYEMKSKTSKCKVLAF